MVFRLLFESGDSIVALGGGVSISERGFNYTAGKDGVIHWDQIGQR